ncbi:hypothetical protein [Acetobacter sp. P5B1]|uniref:hypothetical protein n=1 Tax=Acetobacter sp. P5B1 TaxID=2762620 RepID=UPI001C05C25A|nr:hypothetical protein [Acetobacter sp. P5B1]
MSQSMGGYPDNMRGGIGSPYPAARKYQSMSSNMLAAETANLKKIAAIIRKASEDIAPLVGQLHYATIAIEGRTGMTALDAAIELPAIADEIERDDVDHAEKAAEYV